MEDGIKERLLLQAKKDKDADRADLLALSREVGVLETKNKQLRGLLAGGQPDGADRQEDTKPEESEDTETTEGESMNDSAEDEEPRPMKTKP